MPIQNPNGTAVATGASTGIGAIYADRLARRGFDLLIIARDSKRLTDRFSELTSKTGRKIDIISANLTNKQDLRKVESRLQSDTATSLSVNNAGFSGTKSLVHSSIEDLEDMIALNVTALTRLTAAVLPKLLTRKQGAIINIASVVAAGSTHPVGSRTEGAPEDLSLVAA
jgi:short-subunit dehydrogenase